MPNITLKCESGPIINKYYPLIFNAFIQGDMAIFFSSIFGGIPATGAIARTATNVKNGGRTPVAGIVHAITLLLILLFFGKWASLIPMATMAMTMNS